MPSVEASTNSKGVLLAHELALMASAAKYDLDNRSHRAHSHKSLVRLFFELIEVLDVDLFVEAGAKEASASRRMKKKAPAVRTVAFEANPYTFAEFQAVNLDTGVEYLNLALSNQIGPVTFNVHRDAAGTPIANGQASLLKRQKSREDVERGFIEVSVEGVTLNSFFADSDFARAAVWIDVEGACRFVLPGAGELLAKTSVLIIEVEEQAFWGEDHWLRERVVSFLFDAGLIPVARDFEYQHQYNIVFVRRELLSGPNRIYNAVARFISQAYMPPPKKSAPPESGSAQPPGSNLKGGLRKQVRRARRSVRRRVASLRSK